MKALNRFLISLKIIFIITSINIANIDANKKINIALKFDQQIVKTANQLLDKYKKELKRKYNDWQNILRYKTSQETSDKQSLHEEIDFILHEMKNVLKVIDFVNTAKQMNAQGLTKTKRIFLQNLHKIQTETNKAKTQNTIKKLIKLEQKMRMLRQYNAVIEMKLFVLNQPKSNDI